MTQHTLRKQETKPKNKNKPPHKRGGNGSEEEIVSTQSDTDLAGEGWSRRGVNSIGDCAIVKKTSRDNGSVFPGFFLVSPKEGLRIQRPYPKTM